VAVSLGNGDGTFQAPVKQTYSGQFLNGQGLGVADFNGDGKPDVVLTNPYSVFASGISLGNGDGSLQVTGDSSGTYVNYNFSLTVGGATLVYDMNGDGRPDILATSTQLFGQAAPSGSGAAATPDFALTASVAAGTVSPGAAATTTLTITPSGGFDQAVTLSCSAVPATAGCSFAPASVTPNGTPVTSTLTISTMAAALNGVPGAIDPTLPSGLLLATVGVALTCRRRELRRLRERRLRAGRLRAVAALGVLVALCVLAACGRGDLGVPASVTGAGSTGGAPATGGGTPGTAAGTYTIKITATAGTTVHNVTYTLTVT
jgi:hypothetical protein